MTLGHPRDGDFDPAVVETLQCLGQVSSGAHSTHPFVKHHWDARDPAGFSSLWKSCLFSEHRHRAQRPGAGFSCRRQHISSHPATQLLSPLLIPR